MIKILFFTFLSLLSGLAAACPPMMNSNPGEVSNLLISVLGQAPYVMALIFFGKAAFYLFNGTESGVTRFSRPFAFSVLAMLLAALPSLLR